MEISRDVFNICVGHAKQVSNIICTRQDVRSDHETCMRYDKANSDRTQFTPFAFQTCEGEVHGQQCETFAAALAAI